MPLCVEHIDVVDRFAVGRLRSEACNRLSGRDPCRQRGVFGGHQRACRIFRAGEKHADTLPLGLRNERQNRFDKFFVEFSQNVVTVVRRHRLQQLPGLGAIGQLEQGHLFSHRVVGEHLGLAVDRHAVEQGPDLLRLQSFRKLSHRRRMQFFSHLTEALHVTLGDHAAKFWKEDGVRGIHDRSFYPTKDAVPPSRGTLRYRFFVVDQTLQR